MDKWTIWFIARHWSTNSNWEQVFRGWEETDLNQLSEKWKEDAMKLWESVKKIVNWHPEDFVLVSSDLNRAVDTMVIVVEISGVEQGEEYSELRSQDTGDFTNEKESDVIDEVKDYTDNKPNQPLPWASESHNDFVDRVKKAFDTIPEDYPGKTIIVITHHQVEVLQANDFSKLTDTMYEEWLDPGEIRPIVPISKEDSQILRSVMIAELQTINDYEKMCSTTDNCEVKWLVKHINWEEWEHFNEALDCYNKLKFGYCSWWDDQEQDG